MTHEFDKDYWEKRWREGRAGDVGSMAVAPPSPYLAAEVGDLSPGTALDAGCGAGAEAIWLAAAGWQVTAADISAVALARAAERAGGAGVADRVAFVEADLSTWEPGHRFDLVTTHYAHPAIRQLDFYDRLAQWVAPGGTLLIVGHLQADGHAHADGHGHGRDDDHGHGDGGAPPAEASATAASISARLAGDDWVIVTAAERHREVEGHGRGLDDVVVRAVRSA